MIYFVGGIITMLFAIFFLPESPHYLYSKQKYDEARESLKFISKINGISEMPYFIFDNEVQTDEQKELINDILKEELVNEGEIKEE
jgi:hypothetical protein